jgi:2-haloacid dehalogenase
VSQVRTDAVQVSETTKRTVAFDVIGTLVGLESLRQALNHQGAGPRTLELWFAESLRDYFSISHSGGYSPLLEVLRAGLARHNIRDRDAVMSILPRLDPMPGAEDACRLLAEDGTKLIALTNGSEALTNSLLDHGGLKDRFDAVLSCDSIRVSKPHPSVYAMARDAAAGELWMVASHAWDIAGAGRVGLRTVLIYPEQELVPEVFPRPEVIAPDLISAARAILSA